MHPAQKLFQATQRNIVNDLQEAISEGADIHAKTNDGSHLLEVAQKHGSLAAASFLLVRGVNANVPTSNQETLLHRAARQGDMGFVSLLLEHGADPESLDRFRRRPVDVARPKGGYVHRLLFSKSAIKQPQLF